MSDVPLTNLPDVDSASAWGRYQWAVYQRRRQENTDYTEPEKCVRCKNSIAEHERATFCPCFCSGFHKECAKLSLREDCGSCRECGESVQMVFTHDAEKSAFGRFQGVEEFLEA
jgi:hypothetical protein